MLLYQGEGLVNSLINKLPFELHLPGYQYCGPGTKLQKRLARGDAGINPLDAACKQHDIAYSQFKSLEDRHKADQILENKAWERVKSREASLGERAAALTVTAGMKTKRKLGMGKKNPSFHRDIVGKIRKSMKKSPPASTLKKSAMIAMKAARTAVKKTGKQRVKIPRVIPLKSGGFLPLIPLFAGLSALGALTGGASAIAKTVIDAKNAKKKLEEDHRHNTAMESIGAKGSGLYLRKSARGGLGLYLKKQKNLQ